MNQPDSLFLIRAHAVRAIDALEPALAGMLVTDDNYFDDSVARSQLIKALSATKSLLSHLDAAYEFGNGLAVPKENVCLD